jgi:hypothetical protein
MEWFIGLYLVIGVFKTLNRLASSNPALKPIWMNTERNPIKLALFITLYSLVWPFVK